MRLRSEDNSWNQGWERVLPLRSCYCPSNFGGWGTQLLVVFWVVKFALPVWQNSAPACVSADSQRMIFHSSAVAGLTFCKALNLELISFTPSRGKTFNCSCLLFTQRDWHGSLPVMQFGPYELCSKRKENKHSDFITFATYRGQTVLSCVICEIFLELCSLLETILIFSVIFHLLFNTKPWKMSTDVMIDHGAGGWKWTLELLGSVWKGFGVFFFLFF